MTESFALPLGAIVVGGLAFAAAVAAGLRRHHVAPILAAVAVATFLMGFLI